MSEAIWYYLDANRQSIGPVPAEAVKSALREGAINNATLVWREGLSEWVPLATRLAELGGANASSAETVAVAPPNPAPADSSVYRPPTAELIDYSGAEGDVVPAGFVRRWAAYILDSLILTIPLMMVAFVIAIPFGIAKSDSAATGAVWQGAYYLLWIVAAPLYYAGMESSRFQATLGKQALGIKVTDDNGVRLSFGHALGRWFAAALSYLTLYIGFLMAAFTERKRALHDIVAGTLVVDRWAYTEHPERQKRGLSGCLVAFLVAMLLVPALIGILAAIAIPQYQEYVRRAQSVGTSSGSAYESNVAPTAVTRRH